MRYVLLLLLAVAGCGQGGGEAIPLTLVRHQTLPGLGAAQGVTYHRGLVYIYGDAETGVIREYRLVVSPGPRLVETGRVIRLTRGGEDLLSHPTGLTFHPKYGCFLGDTFKRVGRIFRIDFNRALADGNLDNAVLGMTLDDAAVNGTRPEFVLHDGRWLLATSDYGPRPNFVRFYDPVRLATARRTSEPGVEVRRVPCGPFVQNLHFVKHSGRLVLIQNQVAGLRWRFTPVVDIGAADYRGLKPIDLPRPTDELEGGTTLGPTFAVYVSAMRDDNVTLAIRSR